MVAGSAGSAAAGSVASEADADATLIMADQTRLFQVVNVDYYVMTVSESSRRSIVAVAREYR